MTGADATGAAGRVTAALAAEPHRSVLALDFDGSLAPIVDDPAAARPLPEVLGVLGRLGARLGRVAVVSGRPVAFLADRMGALPVELIGGYGGERIVAGEYRLDRRLEPWVTVLAEAARRCRASFTGGRVEEKPGIGVTLHWRTRPERADECAAVAERVAVDLGLVVHPARRAVELRPPVTIDKGTTVRDLVVGFEAAGFAGDDSGDLPAFAAIRAAVTAGEIDRGVCVGVASEEAPPTLTAAVDLVVDGPSGLADFLAGLIEEIA